ncbi:trehalose-6-phosphate hydrolase [Staphylococcus auricularis]|uniref:Alpha,alpha-phosphotrehalase n=1 Tax=Staphylococcus auricularis TaxID=29379 RepID=A0AAP8PN27_9STAP|nr:alpha,alpha-phosphotrehalase [Staphylococcus auricularis]MBM0868448.1 alpha,alpha-phosphotrehalase [Staphylococcus auricularis]MCG7342404.1 alpha,alpha-phosphotrehalase [Staphylococcus auricularis]MDC6328178.1 alpha,alpha-phosphotrehalase [Staphylococcus auricularis]MDN4533211.1 alpha,alpha-phosphotrehalase [Staphylococcus auricularis]PNZ66536.1 alpha,alpha-phosphotrehalase [Staphylococcus auricularis]
MSQTDWRKSVVYQIYPKSFNDTTGSGQGDLNGIIDKLDYLAYLGVDYIWLTPIYPSPMNDNGYDISDYYRINEQFGTLEDFKRLLEIAHQYGLKVMLDIVFNHTSTDHTWFQQALADPESPYRDYYFFRKGRNGGPPTNWQSKFGGNAWQYEPNSGEYYLHLFDVSQADLNWENEYVRQSLYDIVKYWMSYGVDGFRFDVINLISKDRFEDSDAIGKEYYTDGPRVHDFIHEMNRATFGDREMMTVGEMSSTTIDHCIRYTQPERQELNSVFNFHHLKVDYAEGEKWTESQLDFHKLKEILIEWQLGIYEGGGWNAIFWCNHDQPRIVSRFGDDSTEAMRQRSAKMLAIVLHMLQGTPYIFQGEEIGMTNPHFDKLNQYRDVESLNAYDSLQEAGKSESEIMRILAQKSRDNARTPMQWDDSAQAGFTEGEPWIEVSDNYKEINVQQAMNDEQSVLQTYRKLIQLRHNYDVVTYGNIEPLYMAHDQLFIYRRNDEHDSWLIIANFSNEALAIPEELDTTGQTVIENEPDLLAEGKIPAYGAIVIDQ